MQVCPLCNGAKVRPRIMYGEDGPIEDIQLHGGRLIPVVGVIRSGPCRCCTGTGEVSNEVFTRWTGEAFAC